MSEDTTAPGSDATVTIADLKKLSAAFAHERNWEQFHAPKNLSMAIAAEAAELMEHFLWESAESSRDLSTRKAAIAAELADIQLFLVQFANVAGIDIAAAVTAKVRANAEKYPVDRSRGRADKYTEL